jgi:hypothetical protein
MLDQLLYIASAPFQFSYSIEIMATLRSSKDNVTDNVRLPLSRSRVGG